MGCGAIAVGYYHWELLTSDAIGKMLLFGLLLVLVTIVVGAIYVISYWCSVLLM